jgi:hypothetical protein
LTLADVDRLVAERDVAAFFAAVADGAALLLEEDRAVVPPERHARRALGSRFTGPVRGASRVVARPIRRARTTRAGRELVDASVLENVGVDAAIRLGDPEVWRVAIKEL